VDLPTFGRPARTTKPLLIGDFCLLGSRVYFGSRPAPCSRVSVTTKSARVGDTAVPEASQFEGVG
jgi:hypothetical protein